MRHNYFFINFQTTADIAGQCMNGVKNMKLLCVVRDPINAFFNMTPNNCFLRLREIPENSFFNLFRCPEYEQHWECCGESCQDFVYES